MKVDLTLTYPFNYLICLIISSPHGRIYYGNVGLFGWSTALVEMKYFSIEITETLNRHSCSLKGEPYPHAIHWCHHKVHLNGSLTAYQTQLDYVWK